MAYIKLDENNVVILKQPNFKEGLIEAPESVVCGMIKNGETYENPPKTEEEIAQEIQDNNWKSVYDYWDNTIQNFTVSQTSHEYRIKSKDLESLEKTINRLSDDFIVPVVQEAPLSSFDATVAEIKIVLQEAEELRQNKVREIFIGV